MVEAYIGIGSNLENPIFQVNAAIESLAYLPDTKLVSFSSLYASKPQGPQDQPDFVNAVAKIATHMSATALLSALQTLEREQGKVKKRHWGERLIDLDVLLYGSMTIETSELVVPHPEMQSRDFVLLPLRELASDIPVLGSVDALIKELKETFVFPLNT